MLKVDDALLVSTILLSINWLADKIASTPALLLTHALAFTAGFASAILLGALIAHRMKQRRQRITRGDLEELAKELDLGDIYE